MGFQGMFPHASPRLLGERQSQKVINFKLTSGELRPYMEPTLEEQVTLAGGSIGTIYRWKAGSGQYWFRHPGDVDLIQAPVIGDVWERVYFAGDSRYGEPRYTMTPQAYTGGSEYPVVSYRLGVPAPDQIIHASPESDDPIDIASISKTRPIKVTTSQPHGLREAQVVRFSIESADVDEEADPPESSLSDLLNNGEYQVAIVSDTEIEIAYTDGENLNYTDFVSGTVQAYHDPALRERRFYTHTYVTEFGEEGPPAPASEFVDVGQLQSVTLTLPQAISSETTGRLLEKRRIYRSNVGTQGAAFRFVEELPLGESSYEDTRRSTELAEPLPSLEWDPPPEGLRGLELMPGGIAVGFDDDKVYFSEPYRPHAWPRSYGLSVGHEIVAVGVFDVHVMVATKGFPYLVTGTDPRAMSMRRLEVTQACVSKRSMVSLGYGCVYASADGLVFVSASGAQLITRQHMRADEWAHYHPHTINAFEYEGRYIGFYDDGAGDKGGFVFDPRDPELGFTELDFHAVAGFRDPESEFLYLLLDDNAVVAWDASSEPMEGSWLSKVIHTAYPVNMGAARVIANSYDDLHFRIVADGAEILDRQVHDREPFVLPDGYTGMDWEVEVYGTDQVAEITFGETPEEVAS